ncbi:ankyrin repeat domain-containing protein SOWAHC isoform X2 [Drosophila rhopaloa]|uniref:SOWAHA-C winged helix-turn-helix domain-containing protein n=1 Tax=Drosophila rhopaloa TaxID=1041015 RepID=A0ABM5J464_DRORH|nr:ankyrin repeat domain-containing protein SOWAHC isoform X2 [Drosophila rhopaloa]
MELPKELSIAEIRNYMLANECKVTNHALVKHFKKFLTHPQSQNEARKRFKTYVTLLSTIKNENNQKFLILRKKYVNECPTEEVVERAVAAASSNPEPSSPGGGSLNFDSPMRQPPPYKPPPMVTSPPGAVSISKEHQENYQECVDEFAAAIKRIEPARLEKQPSVKSEDPEQDKQSSRSNSIDVTENKENIPRFSFSSEASTDSSSNEKPEKSDDPKTTAEGDAAENPISVKEATRKFNRMASEEEAKIISPPAKKKPEKQLIEEKDSPEVTLAHPKAKEWIVSMAKANYQELAKMASEYPELVKLQCPATGYTALHWAAKHGNEDVVKLIAGTYKADVNARTNGGYTPLHLATQFGRDNIFELLWNVYKANRDIMDWSGNKPLDYSRQRSSVSASTCSKIQAMRFSGGLNGTWRNQGSQKACNRKRFRLPADWFVECPGKEDHRGVQQFLGSGQWQWGGADGLWQWRGNGSSKSPSPSVSPSPSSASSSPRWYDTESPSESEGSDEHTLRNERRPSVEGECSQ